MRLALLVIAGLAAQAQTVIRTESRLVVVDAVVTDAKGKPLRDLNAAEFRLWDDSKEQKIVSASLETAARVSDQTRRSYLLLFFAGSTISPGEMAKIRRDAARFVDAGASSDRYLAVAWFTNSLRVAQNFTALPDPVKAAIAAAPAIGVTANAKPVPGVPYRPNGAAGASPDEANHTQRSLFPALRAAAEAMASIRGRKALVLFGGGGPRTPDLDAGIAATAVACNRANVAVYVIDSGSTLRGLAEQTGGRVINAAADLDRALSTIVDEQEEYYSLGFVPAETPEGGCHTLRVKVERPGAHVRARSGYCSVRTPDILAGKPEGKALEERAAGATGTLTASVQLPYFYRGPDQARVIVAMEISGFKKARELNLVGVAYKPDGTVAARFSDTVNLAAAGPHHYESQLDLPAGRYTFRISFSAGVAFGKTEAPLVIDPWDGKSAALSAIAFAAATRQVPDLAATLGDAFLEDRRPLRAGSLEITPSGANRCARAARCQAYLEVYDPLPATVALQLRIVDRRTGESKIDAAPFAITPYVRPGNPVTPVPLILPIAALPPGPYRIEIRAAAALRTADLDVE